jgi:hypothetical protein
MINESNGCADCGISRRDHGWRWTETAAAHMYIEPGDAQRLARMKRNRLARNGHGWDRWQG